MMPAATAPATATISPITLALLKKRAHRLSRYWQSSSSNVRIDRDALSRLPGSVVGEPARGLLEDHNKRISKVESCTFGVHENGYAIVSYLVKTISETVF